MAGRDFGADLFSTAEPSTAPATAGQDFGADLFGTPAPTATATPTTGENFGAELFGTTPVVPDTLDARLAAQEAKRAQFAPGEELKKGAMKAATSDLPSMWEQAGIMKDVGAALTVKQRMDLFDKIDKGEITSNDQLRGLDLTTGQGRMYLAAPPETRAKLKGRLTNELANRKEFVQASIDTINEYKKQAKKYAPRVEKASDIGSVADFTNFVASNVGSGAVQLVPLMLAAATTGGVGLGVAGVSMGTSEAVGNRLEFLQKELAQLPQNQRADAVINYLEKTGGTSLAVGVVSGALDTVLGPAATLVKQMASKTLKDQTRKEAVKAAVKEAPKAIAGEAVTGGAQEATQIAGKVGVGERDKFATKETLIDVLNAAAAEAAGSLAGTGVNVGTAALRAKGAQPEGTEERIDPTMGDLDLKPKAPTVEARTADLVKKYREMGMMRDDAEMLARRTVAEQDAEAAKVAKAEADAAAYEKELKDRELADREAEAAVVTEAAPTLESLTADLMDQGLPEDEARVLAQMRLDKEKPIVTQPTQAPSTIISREAPPTLESLTTEFIDQGLTEDEARVQAQLFLDRSKSAPTQGRQDVARPDTEPSGVSTTVPTPATDELPAADRPEGTKRDGVVSTRQDAGLPATGKGTQPITVTTEDQARALTEDQLDLLLVEHTFARDDANEYKLLKAEQARRKQPKTPQELLEAATDTELEQALKEVGSPVSFLPPATIQAEIDKRKTKAKNADRPEVTEQRAVLDRVLPKQIGGMELESVTPYSGNWYVKYKKTNASGMVISSGAPIDADMLVGKSDDEIRALVAERLAKNGIKETPTETKGTTTDGTETTETVQTETKKQEATAAGVAPAKPKRGRPVTLTPEEKAATEADKKEDRAARGRHKRAVDKAEASLQKAITPLDEGEFANEAELKEAQDDQTAERRNAVKELLRVSEESGLKPEGKRARQILRDAKIPQTEIDDIKRGLERAKKALADKTNLLGPASSTDRKGAAVTKADPAFAAFKTGAQAINHIVKTGTRFQKAIAKRLRGFVRDVEFVVLEQDSEIPAQLQQAKYAAQWERSRALFIENFKTGKRIIYVRGASFGNSQGANNVTVLHELLHAATVKKIALAQEYINKGINLNTPLVRAYQNLLDTMRAAQDRLIEMSDNGEMTDALADLYDSTDGDIVADPREFLAYGLSDDQFQEFLMTAEGTQEDTSFFTRFVDSIRRMFGMDESDVNALSDLIVATDSLLTSRIPRGEALPGTTIVSQLKKKSTKVSAAERKLLRSRDAQEVAEDIGILTTLRDPQLFMDALGALWSTANTTKLRALLPAIQTSNLVEWAQNLGIPELGRTWRMSQDMSAMRNKMLSASAAVVDEWLKIQPGIVGKLRGKKNELTALADVMHYSTDQRIDPTKSTKDPVLNKMWNALSPQAQKVYTEVRDFYQAQYDLYRGLLDERIANSSIPGDINDPDTPKGQLMAEIKKAYENGKGMAPYFPLMRYGNFWVRVGNGKAKEFYMFESQVSRELFIKKRVRQLQAAGDSRTEAQMREDQDLDSGNELSGLRKSSIENSTMLKNIFELLDVPGANQDIDALKDQIYQLYLTTMPENNFRRQFIHRKGTAGFSGDALRNFITSSVNMANQLSRIKYGYQMLNSIDTAQASLDGNPDKPRLEMLVKEMGKRIEMDVYPQVDSPFLNTAANFLNKSAFLYFMTSVKTALVQLSSLPIFGVPVLMSRHNPLQVAKEMGRFMLVYNQFGVYKDGKWMMPTIEASKEINMNADERAAIEAMHDRGIAEVTLTYDLMDRQDKPTTKYSSAFNTGTNLLGALFHHTERLNREIIFMSSFRLTMNELEPNIKAKQMTRDEAVEQAIEQAVSDTHTALGNFTAQNRPRIMRAPVGRVLLQFKMFPMFLTTYLLRNGYRATAGMDAAAKKEARIQLIGTLTMSAYLAGYVGVPGASMVLGAIQAFINSMRDEDEEDDPLEKRDLEFWFRSVYLPNLFGDVKIADQRLGEVIDAGALDSLTGYDMSSSLSMNNMWMPELKEQKTAQATMMDYAMSLLGPSASLYLKQFPAAYDDFIAGRTLQGFEKLLPAALRNPVVAYRYSKEGARTATGDVLKEADEFTDGQLIAQALGFRTEGLAAVQEANFKAEALRQKVIQDKGKVRARLDRELELGSDEAVDDAMEKLLKFNAKNPQSAIKADELSKQLLARAKQRAMSDRGFKVDKDMYPYLAELLDLSREKIEREAAKPEK